MNHQEWLSWRQSGIGSSDAAVIMGVSPWKTRHALWQEKVYGPEEHKDSAAMKRGRDLEEPARQCFEKKMNVEVFPKRVVHSSLDWVRATLDGIDLDSRVMVEIKCVNKNDHAVALNDKVPEKYYPQVQHQLLTTGLKGMYYFSFDGSDGKIVDVARDDKYIDEMFSEEKKFWDSVISKEEPELSERDYVSMEGNESWAETVKRWKEVHNSLKELEEKEETLRKHLIELSIHSSAIGHNVKLTKSLTKGSVDYARIPELKGIDVDQYRKNSYYKWRISLT